MQNNNFTRDDGSTNYGQQLIVRNFDANTLFAANKNDQQSQQRGSYQQNANNVPQQQRGQAQNGWQQQQQQNNQQQNNPFANANGPIDIEDDDLPF